jgi:hypothetical protein
VSIYLLQHIEDRDWRNEKYELDIRKWCRKFYWNADQAALISFSAIQHVFVAEAIDRIVTIRLSGGVHALNDIFPGKIRAVAETEYVDPAVLRVKDVIENVELVMHRQQVGRTLDRDIQIVRIRDAREFEIIERDAGAEFDEIGRILITPVPPLRDTFSLPAPLT